jgi:hypothetical protein
MPHTISYNPEIRVIESTVQGDLTLDEAREIITQFALLARENNCFLFLTDYREATVKLSTFEIYRMPQIMSETFASSGLNVHQLKRAIIAAKNFKDYLFFETVTFNRGQNVKLFYNVDEAKKWLYA